MASSPKVSKTVQCPSCKRSIKHGFINSHLDNCLDLNPNTCTKMEMTPKRAKLSNIQTPPSRENKHISPLTSNGNKPLDVSGWGCLGKNLLKNEQASKDLEPSTYNDSSPKHVLMGSEATKSFAPLAEQMRPCNLEEYRGQEKILGEGTMLRKLLESDKIPSMILWGPPGCGKTSIAHIIAKQCKRKCSSRFVPLSATSTGVKEVKEIVEAAKNEQKLLRRKTVLFLDEIHRFNKLQQDVFLPSVENGTIILIGATTENPSFTLNSALLSRCRVFVLEKLSTENVAHILNEALQRLEVEIVGNESNRFRKNGCLCIERKALLLLAEFCDGDARTALNGLQMAVQSKRGETQIENGLLVITEKDVRESLERTHLLYDRKGDQHYDIVSALIKSMRGSDSNAALYWLARMIEGGEDPRFIARRMVVFASEDVESWARKMDLQDENEAFPCTFTGLADPTALTLAASTFQTCQTIGLPECRINLAHCAVYLARAKKSRESYDAYAMAEECVRNHQGPIPPVPLHLRNAPTKLMKELGYGKGNKRELGFLPESLRNVNFFTKSNSSSM